MRYIPKISIAISIISLIMDILYIIVGSNTLGSTGLDGGQFLRFGLYFSHMAIIMAMMCNVYSKMRKIRIEYAGISMILGIIVFASPAIIVFFTSVF